MIYGIKLIQIQDYRQSENLRRLEVSMTEFYTEYDKKNTPLDHIDVIPNGYYSAKVDSNENWVRYVYLITFLKLYLVSDSFVTISGFMLLSPLITTILK